MMKHRILSLLILVGLVLIPIQPTRIATAQGKQAKWTIMVYVAANNNLEENSIINLMEMAAVGSTPDVNIVVQITRPPDYKGFYGEWGGTRRFLVTKSDGGLSTGDFQISPARFNAFVAAVGPSKGVTPDQISAIAKAPVAQQEQQALEASIPVIEKETPLTPPQLTSVEDLGAKVNSGDGATLSDFGTWAVKTYPADHYGLVMWDHGGGWTMIASDDTLGPNGISMPAFQKALDSITQAAGHKFEFVGFDACLMAQLPVLVAVQPYANYAIAAEELVPGFGWDYTPPLKALVSNPELPVVDFAKAQVDAFYALYTGTAKQSAQTFDMGVIDLAKVEDVVKSLSDFNTAVKATNGGELKSIATARSNVQLFANVGESSDEANYFSSIDLSDFMRLMSSLSTDEGVKKASKNVMQAVSQMVLYHKSSASLPNANGLSIFFPADSKTFTAADGQRYRTEFGGTLPTWQDFLDTLYGVADGAAPTNKLVLQITKVSTDQQPGSIQDTPVISYSLNGNNIVGVTAYVIYQVDPQNQIVVDSFPVTSTVTTADGTQVNDYPNGQTANDFYWNTKLSKLNDATNGLLVLMTTNAKDQQHGFIRGIYTNKLTGEQLDSSLLIDLDTYQATGLWVAQNAGKPGQAVAQVSPNPGDTFEPAYRVIDQTGAGKNVLSGTQFTFGSTPFQVTAVLGPDGTYKIVLVAEDAAGNSVNETATVNVQNKGLDTTLQGFKDLGVGISFLYPFDWTDVATYQRQDGLDELTVSNVNGTQTLTAVSYDKITSLADVEAKVKAEVSGIEGVTVGEPTSVTVGKDTGTSLPYTYTDSNGDKITGTAVAVYVTATGQGFKLQIESPDADAAVAQKVLGDVLQTSQFFTPVQ